MEGARAISVPFIIRGKRKNVEIEEIGKSKAAEIMEKWHEDDIKRGVLDLEYIYQGISVFSWNRYSI